MYKRFEYRNNNLLFVVRVGKTQNRKIAPNPKTPIIQTYTLAKEQFECIVNGGTWKDLIKFDAANCGDCPYSGNQGHKAGKCYTHKFIQLKSLETMLKSIARKYGDNFDAIEFIPEQPTEEIIGYAENMFVRFGTYGEPAFWPKQWIEKMAVGSYTGYTHQWAKEQYQYLSNYLMASCHSELERKVANSMGWLAFVAMTENNVKAVHCPASEEMGFKSNCSACSLCSGTKGKGKKDVKIFVH